MSYQYNFLTDKETFKKECVKLNRGVYCDTEVDFTIESWGINIRIKHVDAYTDEDGRTYHTTTDIGWFTIEQLCEGYNRAEGTFDEWEEMLQLTWTDYNRKMIHKNVAIKNIYNFSEEVVSMIHCVDFLLDSSFGYNVMQTLITDEKLKCIY